jgi:hypothetical protein
VKRQVQTTVTDPRDQAVLAAAVADHDLVLALESLQWTPAERLRVLKQMVAFEERAHRARRAGQLR